MKSRMMQVTFKFDSKLVVGLHKIKALRIERGESPRSASISGMVRDAVARYIEKEGKAR